MRCSVFEANYQGLIAISDVGLDADYTSWHPFGFMKPNTYPQLRCLLLFTVLFFAPVVHAQWIGAGTTGGTGGTDFNDLSNWTGGTINGDFSSLTGDATINLSGNASVASLNFGWVTAGHNVSIQGNGIGANKVLIVGGGIAMPRATSAGSLVFGSNLTLDFGEITSIREIQRTSNTGSGSTVGTLRIDSLITGSASGNGQIRFANNASFSTALTNDENAFDSPLGVSGELKFTSIGNVGAGASSLGAPTTVANGKITINRNGKLNYTGETDQSSDRQIVINGGAGPVAIYHTGASGTLRLSSNLVTGTYAQQLDLRASNTNAVLEITGAITNTGTGATKVTINEGGASGIVRLKNTTSDYKGNTQLKGGGVLEVIKFSNGGEVSSIGASSSEASNLLFSDYGDRTATIRYIGMGDSTDRLFTLTRIGGIIESSGSGALVFTNTGDISTSAPGTRDYDVRLLTLGGTNAGDNKLAASLGDHENADSSTTASRISKTGAGKWILTGNHTYTGATIVSAGTLIVNGSLASAVTVNAGNFGGTGRTTQNVTIGNGSGTRDATFMLGTGIGGFDTDGVLDFKSDAVLRFDLNSTSDLVDDTSFAVASGAITINSSSSFLFTDLGDGTGLKVKDSFTVLQSNTSVTGTFAGLAEGATFDVGGVTWKVSYQNKSFTLTVDAIAAVPEPVTVAMVFGLATMVVAIAIRRRS